MPLTPAQLTTLKNNIAANTNTILINGVPTAINSIDLTNPSFAQAICDQWYNLNPATAFYAYFTGVTGAALQGAVWWKHLNPTDAPSSTNAAIFIACNMCQSFALAMVTQASIDATQKSIVQGFADNLSAVPSAGNGATRDAGWTTSVSGAPTVPQVLSRLATNAEVLFANTTAWGQGGSGASQTPGATGPATLTFQGSLSGVDITAAANGAY